MSVLLLLAVVLAGCRPPALIRRALQRPSPHAEYLRSLEKAGLGETALATAWREASEQALSRPVQVTLPFREVAYFSPTEAIATGYRFMLRRGQQLQVEWEPQAPERLVLFLDLFEAGDPPRRVTSAGTGERRLQFEADKDQAYVLRAQPELLRGGRVVLTQRLQASLAFPVPAAANRVESQFGDPRDAGRRRHEGIDIFAPRGTAAVASVDGTIRDVGVNRLGGNVVWLWDESRWLSVYYAHLDSASVAVGQRVKAGDTIGRIGNTGNARSTAPHLHFGIYAFPSGALDPLPFVTAPDAPLPAVPANPKGLGEWRRVARTGVQAAGAIGARTGIVVQRHTPVRVDAASQGHLRVRLPDGTPLFVRTRDTEAVERAVSGIARPEPTPLLVAPEPGAAIVGTLPSSESQPVLGRYGGYLLVRDQHGREGWVSLGVPPKP